MCKNAFKSFPDLANYCDNCIYNHINTGKVLEFELHNMTVRQAMIYKKTLEYLKFQLCTKYDHLHTINS